jgi:hypothetical protein
MVHDLVVSVSPKHRRAENQQKKTAASSDAWLPYGRGTPKS